MCMMLYLLGIFQETPQPLRVELHHHHLWLDVADYVLHQLFSSAVCARKYECDKAEVKHVAGVGKGRVLLNTTCRQHRFNIIDVYKVFTIMWIQGACTHIHHTLQNGLRSKSADRRASRAHLP